MYRHGSDSGLYMFKKIRYLLGKTNSVSKSTYIWNTVNASVLACQSPVILMVMTRTNGLYDVGVFSIAYAVANLMVFIGQYGMRRFQASDVNEKYSFGEYYGMRVLSCITMMAASAVYCVYGVFFNGYGSDKFAMVMLMCGLKCIQAYSDVIHGRMQQLGRLDVATKASSVRYAAEILAFVIMLVMTGSLIASASVCLAVSIMILYITSMNAARDYCTLKSEYDCRKLKLMLIEGFPLFVSLFLNMYISNAPKYAIDAYLTEDIQAYYNLIFMPAFAVGLMAHFIFNPILTSYAKLWVSGNLGRLRKLIMRQMALIAGLTAFGLAVAYTIGIPVLSFIFGVDLSQFRQELCIVMIGGGMLAYATFFSTVITIIRCHNSLIVCYGITALAAKLMSRWFVLEGGIHGATVMYSALMTVLGLMLFAVVVWGIRQKRNQSQRG